MKKVLMMKLSHFLPIDQFPINQFGLELVPVVNYNFFSSSFFRNFSLSGSLNLDETSQQFRDYLRDRVRPPPYTNQKVDELARHYMYTSAQQAASDEVAWGKMIAIKFFPSNELP
jgi:hypothetical protein